MQLLTPYQLSAWYLRLFPLKEILYHINYVGIIIDTDIIDITDILSTHKQKQSFKSSHRGIYICTFRLSIHDLYYTFSFRTINSNIIHKRKRHLALSLYLIRKKQGNHRCFPLPKFKYLIQQ